MINLHYPAYLKEYRDQDHIETDYGFISYVIHEDTKAVYMVDLYVVPERRKEHLSGKLMLMAMGKAKALGCTHGFTHVYSHFKDKEISLLVALEAGGKIASVTPESIMLRLDFCNED